MTILGLDIGDRRIGMALADEEGTLAVPIGTLERTALKQDIQCLTEIAHDRRATLIVVGLPISINGTLGPQAKKTHTFLDRFRRQTQLPFDTIDERYTSNEAERLMQASGAQPSRNRRQVDAAAATILLQAYLDQRVHRTSPTNSVGTGT